MERWTLRNARKAGNTGIDLILGRFPKLDDGSNRENETKCQEELSMQNQTGSISICNSKIHLFYKTTPFGELSDGGINSVVKRQLLG